MADLTAKSAFNRPLSYSSSVYSEVTIAAAPHSPSIYSQDTQSPPATPIQTQSRPLLFTRQDSVRSSAASSTTSSLSRAPTIYSEETIKALGYRPFEYWKGPKRAPYPVDYHKDQKKKMAAAAAANGENNGEHEGMAQLFLPPRARLRNGVQSYYGGDTDADFTPPTSPTVKDRYRQRQRQRQIERAAKQRTAIEWPHWVSSSSAKKSDPSRRKKSGWTRLDDSDEEKALISSGASSPASSLKTKRKAAWQSPSSWQRRTWGIILILLVLCVVGAVITLVNLPTDNLVRPEAR